MNFVVDNSWSTLVSDDENIRNVAWSAFVGNLKTYVRLVPQEVRGAVVEKGMQWNGAGYGQGSLGRLIYELSGECVLSVSFDEYRNVVLVALALYWTLPTMPLVLEGSAKAAAFAICKVLSDEDSKPSSAPSVRMPWKLQQTPLPKQYSEIIKKLTHSLDDSERAHLLKDVPFFTDLPHDPPVNNHGKDASVAIERTHRAWESQVYKAIRLLVSLDLSMEDDSSSVPFEPEALCERLFSILLDLALRMQEHRKAKSIPESLPHKNPLFSKADLALAKSNSELNRFRRSKPSSQPMAEDAGNGQGRFNRNFRGNRRNNNSRSQGKGKDGGGKGAYRPSAPRASGSGDAQG